MRYAVISDIHGNYPAFKAIMKDSEGRVDRYVLMGDYAGDLPYGNEVMDLIRSLPNAYVIRGNKEDRLIDMLSQRSEEWVYDRYASQYYTFRSLSHENMKYIAGLPDTLYIRENGFTVRLAHNDPVFLEIARRQRLSSGNYRRMMLDKYMDRGDFVRTLPGKAALDNDWRAFAESMSENVVITGHSHVQWHVFAHDKLFINPGSAGQPLDFDTAVPYTILEIASDGSGCSVEERRVAYDAEAAISDAKASEMYRQAAFWMELGFYCMRNAMEIHSIFLAHLIEVERELEKKGLGSNEIWRRAIESFEAPHSV